jgi:hypothetical protein
MKIAGRGSLTMLLAAGTALLGVACVGVEDSEEIVLPNGAVVLAEGPEALVRTKMTEEEHEAAFARSRAARLARLNQYDAFVVGELGLDARTEGEALAILGRQRAAEMELLTFRRSNRGVEFVTLRERFARAHPEAARDIDRAGTKASLAMLFGPETMARYRLLTDQHSPATVARLLESDAPNVVDGLALPQLGHR